MQQRGSSNKPEEIFITNLKLLGFDPLVHCKDTNIIIDKDTFTTRPNCIKAFEVITYFLFNELDKIKTRRTFHDIWPITCTKDSLLYRARAFTWLTDIRPDTLLESVPLRKSYLSDCRGEGINKIIMAFSTIVLERLGKQRNIVSTSNPKMSKSSLIKESIASSDRYKEIRLKAIDSKKRWGDEQADLVSQIESKKQKIQHRFHSCSLTTNDTITQLNQQYHNVKAYNERKEREEIERLERERIEKARIEQEQRERERVEQQRLERERIEKERLKRERIEKERLEKERLEKERLEKERLERERIEQERLERERIERERREKERLEQEHIEQERIEKERHKKERIEQERIEKEREKEQLELERIEKERREQELIEQERIEKEWLEHERIKKEQRKRERLEQQQLEQELIEKERLEQQQFEQERIEKEQHEKERLELERIEKERREQERIEQERVEKKWLEHERIKKEQREKERLKQEQLEQELIEKERLEQQQFEQERIEKERLERQRAEEKRIKQDKIRQERVEQECSEEEKSREKEKSMTQEKLLRDRLEKDRRYNDFRDKERRNKERRNKEPGHQVHHGSGKLGESPSEKRDEENKIVEKGFIVGQEERDKHIQLGQVFSGLEVNGPVANNISKGPERLPRKRTSEVLKLPEAYKKLKSYPSSPHTPIKNPTNATEVYQQTLHILNSSAEPNTNYVIPTLPSQIIPSLPLQSVSSVRPKVASTPQPKVVCPSPAKIASLSPPQPASSLLPKSNTIGISGNDSTVNKNVDYSSPKRTTSTDTHTPSKPINSSRTPNTSYTPNDEKFKQVFQSQNTFKNTPPYQGSLTGKVYGSPMRTSDQLIPNSDDYPSPERLRNSRSPRSPFSTSGTPSRLLNSSQIVYSPQRPNIRGIDDDDSDFDMESVVDIQEEEPPEWTPMRMKTPKRV